MNIQKRITQLIATALVITCCSSYATAPSSELTLERQKIIEDFNMDMVYVDKNHPSQVDKVLSYFSDPDQSHIYSPKVDYSPLYGKLSARDYFTAVSNTAKDAMINLPIIYSPANAENNMLAESIGLIYNYDQNSAPADPRYTYEFYFVDNSTKIQALLIYANPLAPMRWGH